MNRKSGTFSLLWANGKQGALASDGILALGVGLLAFAMAVVIIVLVMPLANPEVSPGITAGVEASSARWSALGQLYAQDNQDGNGVGVAQALAPDEAFIRSVALTGPSPAGYAVAGPTSAAFGSLSMSPSEAEAYAYARSLAQVGPGIAPDEAFIRSVALTGPSPAGYAVAGPTSAAFGSLSMSPSEAEAYAQSLALAGLAVAADEAFVRSVALTGQSPAGYAVAGPTSAAFGSLSPDPIEAYAYAQSLAQTGPGIAADEAFIRGVALTGQSPAGYAVAGPTSTAFGSLSMGPSEAEAYARNLALAGPGIAADEAFIRSVALTGQSPAGYAVAGPTGTAFGSLSMGPSEAEAYAWSLAQTGQGSVGVVAGPCSVPVATLSIDPTEAYACARSLAQIGQGSVGYTVAGPSSAPVAILSIDPTEVYAYARSLAQTGQGWFALVVGPSSVPGISEVLEPGRVDLVGGQ